MLCRECQKRPRHARGMCRACYDKWLKRRDPHYAERQRANVRQWQRANKPHRRNYNRKRDRLLAAERYGIPLDEVERILARGCEVCGRTDSVCIDHDHRTGAVRGCLCVTCNVGVGWVDDAAWFAKARLYLSRAGGGGKG